MRLKEFDYTGIGVVAGFILAGMTMVVTGEAGLSMMVLVAAPPTLGAAARELNTPEPCD